MCQPEESGQNLLPCFVQNRWVSDYYTGIVSFEDRPAQCKILISQRETMYAANKKKKKEILESW